MDRNVKDIPKRDLTPESSATPTHQNETSRSPKRAKVERVSVLEDESSTLGSSSATAIPEATSPTSGCRLVLKGSKEVGSLRSPSPEPVQRMAQPMDDDRSIGIRGFHGSKYYAPVKVQRPLPRRPFLESPSPSPDRVRLFAIKHPADDIADTESSDSSSDTDFHSSGSSTFSQDREQILHMPAINPAWPVNIFRSHRHPPDYDVPDKLRDIGERNPLFCCKDLRVHPRTNPIMPNNLEEIHGPVLRVFLASIGRELEQTIYLSQVEASEVNRVVKVNRVGAGVEISTYLFMIDELESVFLKILNSRDIMPFNPQGKGSYQSYYCPTHRNLYRIGVYDKRYSYLKGRMSFGDILIDQYMGLLASGHSMVFYDMDPSQSNSPNFDHHSE